MFFKHGLFKSFLIFKILFLGSLGWCYKPGGWLWYKDPVLLPDKKPKPSQKKDSKSNALSQDEQKSARQRMSQQREAFEESLALAILEPTLENMGRVQHMQRFILDQATDFQDSWMASETLMRPFKSQSHNPLVREMRDVEEKQYLDRQLKKMAQTYGLFFIVSSTCHYCHLFAPLVRSFADHYAFEIQVISADGKGIQGFPDPLPDNGIIQTINPQGFYPSLYFVNKKNHQIIPLAQSLLNKDELLENVKYILRFLEGQL